MTDLEAELFKFNVDFLSRYAVIIINDNKSSEDLSLEAQKLKNQLMQNTLDMASDVNLTERDIVKLILKGIELTPY